MDCKNKRNGISLIVLVITIIVIVILAGAVILTLSENNPINAANEAVFKSDLDAVESDLSLYLANEYTSITAFNPDKLNADDLTAEYNDIEMPGKTIKDIIPVLSKTTKYDGQFEVVNGKLVYIGTDRTKKKWAQEVNVDVIDADRLDGIITTLVTLPVSPGTNVIATIKISSNASINKINLTGNLELLDINNVAVPVQPVFEIGTPSGNETDTLRNVEVTIKTNTLAEGTYKLKLKAGAISNIYDVTNETDIVTGELFEIDNTPPTNPGMLSSPTGWTNSDVTVTITYPSDSVTKEYSIDGENWSTYTSPVTATTNNTTVYARAIDIAGNQSSQSTITMANIDKYVPEIFNLDILNGTYYQKINNLVVDTTVDIIDSISGIDTLQYVWDTQNVITPITGWNNFKITDTLINNNIGNYYLWVKVVDKAGNITVGKSGIFYIKDLNEPVLASGMTPIKLNADGSMWVTTTISDSDWYDYSNKKWANAQTADGSMWVWIPRYEYKIQNPHSSIAQTITINLIKGTGTTATSGYTVHPAFSFGNTELTGIWVAKFEASNSLTSIESKAGAISIRSVTLGNIFTACRNMETINGTRYGWGTTGTGLDTHLIKNTEWGAVAYLTNSALGKNSEVLVNSNSNFYTGGGTGTAYVTNVAQSTTGNMYGIYDMSGGAMEYTAAYVNNPSLDLTYYSASLVNAPSQYKDVYICSADKSRNGNYTANSSKKGDAIYETSSDGGDLIFTSSWYTDYSGMPYSTYVTFGRGGYYNNKGTESGIFGFDDSGDWGYDYFSFRPIIAVASGL